MENLRESLKELEEISKVEELEEILKNDKIKIYDSQHLPYEISEEYLRN